MTSTPVIDLQYFQPVRHRFRDTWKEMTHVHWQTYIFSSHGLHAHALILTARRLYSNESFGIDLQQSVYALDATTIDLCLSMFPWATFRTSKAAIKLHTLLDLRGNIPTFICISDGSLHDVNILDTLPIEPGVFYIMDRGYLDYARLHAISLSAGFFVTRSKSNLRCRRVYSHQIDRTTGLRYDQTIMLTGFHSLKGYPSKLRRVKYYDAETQIWIAVSVYVIVAILKKRLNIPASLYTILQILSV